MSSSNFENMNAEAQTAYVAVLREEAQCRRFLTPGWVSVGRIVLAVVFSVGAVVLWKASRAVDDDEWDCDKYYKASFPKAMKVIAFIMFVTALGMIVYDGALLALKSQRVQ